jgi:methionyl-tRNA formyltransferase
VTLRRLAWVSFDEQGRDCLLLAAELGAEIAAVVTLPGPVDPHRAGQCTFDEAAARVGAPLIQTADVNSTETLAALRDAAPDAIFVVGWSQLVHADFLSIAAVFGMHPALLPRHRGRAAIPWAILSGLARTGVSLFEIVDATADSGPLVGQVEIPLAADETATSLYRKVGEAQRGLVRRWLPELMVGSAPRIPQDPRRMSSWPRRRPDDGIIDWQTRASYLYDWVRAQTRPYPGAFTFLGDRRITVWRVRPVGCGRAEPGRVVDSGGVGATVACGEDAVVIEEAQADGLAPMSGDELATLLPPGAMLG